MPQVLNKRDKPLTFNGVYIGRPSKWGNPFLVGKDGTREMVINKYRDWILSHPTLANEVYELRGKDLICWCSPKPCHGDILIDLANKDK